MSWTKFPVTARGELSRTMVAKAILLVARSTSSRSLDMEEVFTKLVADLRGDPESEMLAKCEIWYRDHVALENAPAARVAIGAHRRAGHAIVLGEGLHELRWPGRSRAASASRTTTCCRACSRSPAAPSPGAPARYASGRHKVVLAEGVGEGPRHRSRRELLLFRQLQRSADALAGRLGDRGEPGRAPAPAREAEALADRDVDVGTAGPVATWAADDRGCKSVECAGRSWSGRCTCCRPWRRPSPRW